MSNITVLFYTIVPSLKLLVIKTLKDISSNLNVLGLGWSVLF